jgi:hypothetical protein
MMPRILALTGNLRFFPQLVTGPGALGLLLLRLVTGAAFLFHG